MRILAGTAVLSVCLSVVLLTATERPPNTLTAEEQAAGWQLLFDGQTPSQWRNYKRDALTGEGWTIEDGCLKLRANGKGGGDIQTRDKYADFEFSIDVRFTPNANSGLMYHVDGETEPCWQSGPEVQLLGDAPEARDKHAFGSLYDMIAPNEKKLSKPVGEWNTLVIKLENGVAQHYVNGELVVEYPTSGPEWDALVAASKFSKMPNFGKSAEGYLCIQDHGNEVWFRNIKIRVIKPATP